MANLDIKSLVIMSQDASQQTVNKSADSRHASINSNNNIYKNEMLTKGIKEQEVAYASRGPALNVQPMFVMTPDGMIHRQDKDGNYIPEITSENYFKKSKNIQD